MVGAKTRWAILLLLGGICGTVASNEWNDSVSGLGYTVVGACRQPLLVDDYRPSVPGRTDVTSAKKAQFPVKDGVVVDGTRYRNFAMNARSMFLAFFPSSVADPLSRYDRELIGGPRLDVGEGPYLPLLWSSLLTGLTGNFEELRIVCIWCDETRFDGERFLEQVDGQWAAGASEAERSCPTLFSESVSCPVDTALLAAKGNGVTRVVIRNVDHLGIPEHPISATVSLRNGTGVIQVVYRQIDIAQVGSGKAGLQFSPFVSDGEALTLPGSWFDGENCFDGEGSGNNFADRPRSSELNSLTVTYFRDGVEDACSGLSCGPYGDCVDGVCVCRDGYWGEFCEVSPARVWIRAPPYHDGATAIPIEVALDRDAHLLRPNAWDLGWRVPLNRSIESDSASVLTSETVVQAVYGNGSVGLEGVDGEGVLFGVDASPGPQLRLSDGEISRLQAVKSRFFRLLVPLDPEHPEDVTISVSANALFHSMASNAVVVRYRPVLTIECTGQSVVQEGDFASGREPPRSSSVLWSAVPSHVRDELGLPSATGQVRSSAARLDPHGSVLLGPEFSAPAETRDTVLGRVISPPGLPATAYVDLPQRLRNSSLFASASGSATVFNPSLIPPFSGFRVNQPPTTWDRSPPSVDEEVNCTFDGLHPISIVVRSSAPIRDFGLPSQVLSVLSGAGVVVDTPLSETLGRREFGIRVIPAIVLLKDDRSDISVVIPENATNGGNSWPSNRVRLQFSGQSRRFFPTGRDFDERGILYWAGSRMGTDLWRNPAGRDCLRRGETQVLDDVRTRAAALSHLGARGLAADGRLCVAAMRTSNISGDDEDACIADRNPAAVCYTRPLRNQAWQVDFGDSLQIRPSHYTVRDGEDALQGMLRSWVLEGTKDLEIWTVLDQRTDDLSLTRPRDAATFEIRASEQLDWYRAFRIRQTGPNSRGAFYLNLGGLEIYGSVHHPGDPCAELRCGAHGECRYGTPRTTGDRERQIVVEQMLQSHRNNVQDGLDRVHTPWNARSHAPAIWATGERHLTHFGAEVGIVQGDDLWPSAHCHCSDGYGGPFCTVSPADRRTRYDMTSNLQPILQTDNPDAEPPSTIDELVEASESEKRSLIAAGLIGHLRRGQVPHYDERTAPLDQVAARTFWWPVPSPVASQPQAESTVLQFNSSCLVGHFKSECRSATGLGSYWGVEFSNLAIKLTGYAIRDGSFGTASSLPRSWRLEALRMRPWNEESGYFGGGGYVGDLAAGYFRETVDDVGFNFADDDSNADVEESSKLANIDAATRVLRSYGHPGDRPFRFRGQDEEDVYVPSGLGRLTPAASQSHAADAILHDRAASRRLALMTADDSSILSAASRIATSANSGFDYGSVGQAVFRSSSSATAGAFGRAIESRRGEGHWVSVDVRTNEASATFPGAIVSFSVPKQPPARAFRIVTTGLNARGDRELWLSGLELYGHVYDIRDPCASFDCGPNGLCDTTADINEPFCTCSTPEWTGPFCTLPRRVQQDSSGLFPVNRTGELLLALGMVALFFLILLCTIRIAFAKLPKNLSFAAARDFGVLDEQDQEEYFDEEEEEDENLEEQDDNSKTELTPKTIPRKSAVRDDSIIIDDSSSPVALEGPLPRTRRTPHERAVERIERREQILASHRQSAQNTPFFCRPCARCLCSCRAYCLIQYHGLNTTRQPITYLATPPSTPRAEQETWQHDPTKKANDKFRARQKQKQETT